MSRTWPSAPQHSFPAHHENEKRFKSQNIQRKWEKTLRGGQKNAQVTQNLGKKLFKVGLSGLERGGVGGGNIFRALILTDLADNSA